MILEQFDLVINTTSMEEAMEQQVREGSDEPRTRRRRRTRPRAGWRRSRRACRSTPAGRLDGLCGAVAWRVLQVQHFTVVLA
ncbi:hypothetical protein CDZ95_27230 [Mameliella alba]|nr:hypothetical protein CDZ95_27230 [Mameliella alba]